MKTTHLVIAAVAGLLALAACHKTPEAQPGDNIAAAINSNADSIDAAAANMSNAAESSNLNGMANNMRSDSADVAAAFNSSN